MQSNTGFQPVMRTPPVAEHRLEAGVTLRGQNSSFCPRVSQHVEELFVPSVPSVPSVFSANARVLNSRRSRLREPNESAARFPTG